MNLNRKAIVIKTSKNRKLYITNVDPIKWSRSSEYAKDFSSFSDDEIKIIIEDINDFSFLNDGESFQYIIQKIDMVVDEIEYTPKDILIKTALKRLSNEEIIALGIEDIGLYHNIKETNKEFGDGDIGEDYECDVADDRYDNGLEENISLYNMVEYMDEETLYKSDYSFDSNIKKSYYS